MTDDIEIHRSNRSVFDISHFQVTYLKVPMKLCRPNDLNMTLNLLFQCRMYGANLVPVSAVSRTRESNGGCCKIWNINIRMVSTVAAAVWGRAFSWRRRTPWDKNWLITDWDFRSYSIPPHSPDLSPSDYHMFWPLKDALRGRRFVDDDEVKEAVHSWLTAQPKTILKSIIFWDMTSCNP
jgi:hypothetical protein